MTPTFNVESRLADGTLVDVIATGLRWPEVKGVIDECEAERAENPGAIVGKLMVVPVYEIERPYKAQTAQYKEGPDEVV
jgi:hypothetical protein